jgi:hypothetical protein
MKKFKLKEGHEIRGFKIRLYPDKEQEEKLKEIEASVRVAWNWLVGEVESVLLAREAFAVRRGLVPPRAPAHLAPSP